jgi:hypothetical protein
MLPPVSPPSAPVARSNAHFVYSTAHLKPNRWRPLTGRITLRNEERKERVLVHDESGGCDLAAAAPTTVAHSRVWWPSTLFHCDELAHGTGSPSGAPGQRFQIERPVLKLASLGLLLLSQG